SKDSKRSYFTQLIWADTTFVGCGRAKFFVSELNTVVERLICNFAPKGNNHKKPIYTIGYPGTQCSKQMIPDIEFPGLCLQTTEPAPKFIDNRPSASSLLRILNLSNSSLKQQLDPNNLKQINENSSEINDQRNQKTRHVYLNNSYGAMKRDSARLQNPMRNIENYNEPPYTERQYTQRQFTQERGHSHMYHGYQSSKETMYNQDITQIHTESDFRRSDFTSGPLYSKSIHDARKHYVGSQCTRQMMLGEKHNCFSPDPPCKSKTNECTRGQANECPHPCQLTTFARFEKVCPCNEQTPPTIQIPCECKRKCQPTTNCPSFTTTYCPHRKLGGDEPDKSSQFDNYDLFHNLEVKSGDKDLSQKQPWSYENPTIEKLEKAEYSRRESDTYKQVKSIVDDSQPKIRKQQDSYRSFDYSERKKRDLEDLTFKPFWQMDEYNQKQPPELKSIRYTTLNNKRKIKARKTALTTRLPTSTETITIKPKDKSSININQRGRVTEKYLSFDELMHLRKLSTAESIDNDARRRADNLDLRDGVTVESTTTSITANTPFYRQKHCTRKLTCTWTAAYNGSGGAGGVGGGGHDVGSRTPPGYVDGCTRTSTCTRDYMDRNKMATASEISEGTTLEDEDYCERRSLNIRRRNLVDNGVTTFSIGYQEAFTELPLVTTKIDEQFYSSEVETSSQTDNFHCICYEDATRVKRGEISGIEQLLSKDCIGMNGDENSKRLMY
ncbi:putative Ves G 5 allergen, partial [Operophtera brumata]